MDFIHKYQYLYMVIPILLSGLLFSLPIFGKIVKIPEKNRYVSMDSTRYFLAAAVFLLHSYLIAEYFYGGAWNTGSVLKMYFTSQVAVSIFFMISGFLFWGIIKKDNIDWKNLYIGRFFRISPLLMINGFLSVTLLIFITNAELNSHTLRMALFWMDPIRFIKPNINGFEGSIMTHAGVQWTLVYEWGFYFSLPLLWFFRKNSKEFIFSLCFLSVYASDYFLNTKIPFNFMFLFVLGMFVTEIKDSIKISKKSMDIVMFISILLMLIIRPEFYQIHSYLNVLYVIILFCIVNGADLFGLLRISGFVRLGHLSFSIYIMHGLVSFIVYGICFRIGVLRENFLLISYANFFITLSVCCATHRYIELYFYDLRKKFTK